MVMKPEAIIVLVGLLATASLTDIRHRRIPNWLTLTAAVAGLTLNAAAIGARGVLFGIEGLLLGMGLFMVPYLLGGMGAGDVKLMASVGAMVGPHAAFVAALCAALAGGVYALAVISVHPRARATRTAVMATLVGFFSFHSLRYDGPAAGNRKPRLCYGVAIAVGTIAAVILEAGWRW
jgi:prepilin peptidase CpaA